MTMNLKLAKWLWRTSKGLRLQSVLNTAIGISAVLMDFSLIFFTKRIIDIATGRNGDELRWAAAFLVLTIATKILLAFASRWVGALLGVRSQNRIQVKVFSHLMRCVYNGIEHRHSGDMTNRLERDVRDVTSTITETMPAALALCTRLAGAFLMLHSMDRRLAFILIAIAPCFALLSKVYIRRMRTITREVRHTDSQIQSIIQESIQNRIVIKTLGRTGTMIGKLELAQKLLSKQIRKKTIFSSISATLLNTGFSLGYLVTFLWGALRLQDGSITYGTMLAFIQFVGQIQSPLREMSRFVPAIVGSLTAGERLMELEDTPVEEEGSPILFENGAGIRLKDVTYSYDKANGKANTINNLTYDFPPGSITAILGETGVGKTTLIRLILALIKPDSGCLEMYDDSHHETISARTRNNLIYIPQGNTLLSGTVRENLLMGNPKATEEEMVSALRTACAEFVLQSPLGLDSMCGEHGTGLSEGQSQRISIARALLKEGCVLLLDEATSALDADTERQLLTNLHDSAAFKQTVICVTHRPAIVEFCSQVLKLSKG